MKRIAKHRKAVCLSLVLCMLLTMLLSGCGKTANNNTAKENNTNTGAADIEWPTGTIDIIVPSSAGSNTDMSVRVLTDYLTKTYPNAKFNIKNEKTGEGTLASELCRTAKPDGHTLYFTGSGNNILFHTGKYNYSTMDPANFTIIGRSATGMGRGSILLTQPDKPYNNCQEFVDYCKAHPGEVTFATSTGSSQEVKNKLFAQHFGIEVKWVVVSGSELVTNLLGNRIDVGLQSENNAAQYIEQGSLKGLFNNTMDDDGASAATKDIETYKDLGLESIAFYAPMYYVGPAGMDPALVEKINSVLNGVAKDQESVERWAKMNTTWEVTSVEEITKQLKQMDSDIESIYKK